MTPPRLGDLAPLVTVYVVYKNPLDYPGCFVVRKWNELAPDPDPLIVADRLDKARLVIPKWCTNLGRFPEDDPVILECWI